MAQPSFTLPSGIVVQVFKRRGTRSMRLSIKPDGSVRVTMPYWVSYAAAQQFVLQKQAWIEQHVVPTPIHYSGQQIGKAHHLLLVESSTVTKPQTRVKDQQVIVQYPAGMEESDPNIQTAIEKAALRALLAECKKLLPQRVEMLATRHGYSYRSLHFKRLKSRWGSCDQDGNIIFNAYLMQLPWELIDYVILHELAHTRVMKHGSEFWAEMASTLPDVETKRKMIKKYQPQLGYSSD